MKRIVAVMLILLLVTAFPSAFAEENEENSPAWQMWNAICRDSNEQYHAQLALNVTYDEQTGHIILSGQPSPLVQQYLQNVQKYQEEYPNVACTVKIVVDFQFNDNPWYSAYLDESMQVSEIFTHEYALRETESKNFAFSICNVQKYTPELDANNVLEDIVEYRDDIPYIDFSKHTLRTKVKIMFTFDSPEIFLEAEDTNDVISVYHNNKVDIAIENALPWVKVNRAIYNTCDNQVLIEIKPSAEVDSLLLAQHDIELQVHYKIEDDWSSAYTIPVQYQTSIYVFSVPTISYADDSVMLRLRWQDNNTDTSSEYVAAIASLKHTPGFDEDSNIVHISNNLCPLCKKCNTPADICLLIWISAGVTLAISVISFTVFIIISIRKKQNTNKETNNA